MRRCIQDLVIHHGSNTSSYTWTFQVVTADCGINCIPAIFTTLLPMREGGEVPRIRTAIISTHVMFANICP